MLFLLLLKLMTAPPGVASFEAYLFKAALQWSSVFAVWLSFPVVTRGRGVALGRRLPSRRSCSPLLLTHYSVLHILLLAVLVHTARGGRLPRTTLPV